MACARRTAFLCIGILRSHGVRMTGDSDESPPLGASLISFKNMLMLLADLLNRRTGDTAMIDRPPFPSILHHGQRSCDATSARFHPLPPRLTMFAMYVLFYRGNADGTN
jgi:hypothetical protein